MLRITSITNSITKVLNERKNIKNVSEKIWNEYQKKKRNIGKITKYIIKMTNIANLSNM